MSSIHQRAANILATAVVIVGLGACTTTAVTQQTTALNTAAAQFETMVAAPSPITSAEATLTQARMLQAVYNGSIQSLSVNCYQPVKQLQAQYASDVVNGASSATLDADYKKMIAAKSCGLEPVAAIQSPAPPQVISDLKGYFDALQAIATAKDDNSFNTAAQGLSTSIANMAKATGQSAVTQAIPAVLAQLAQKAVEEREYEFLRLYVPEMDGLLGGAATPITTALRVQQSYYLTVVAQDANEGMGILNNLYSAVSVKRAAAKKNAADKPVARKSAAKKCAVFVKRDPVATLAVYAESAPIIDEFEAEQNAARVDPATAFNALLAAHHALSLALQADQGEPSAILASASDIGTSAQSLVTDSNSALQKVVPNKIAASQKGK